MCLQNKSVENTVGKGEIAHNEQFLLFPESFSTLLENILLLLSNLKLSSADFEFGRVLKFAIWERVESSPVFS